MSETWRTLDADGQKWNAQEGQRQAGVKARLEAEKLRWQEWSKNIYSSSSL